MSSGAWKVAEERAAQRGAPRSRRVAGAAAPSLQGQMGLPNRIERLIRIEQETARMERRLRDRYADLAAELGTGGERGEFERRWRRQVEITSYIEVNELIDEHHEWFPIEANLRWDMALGDFRAPFGLPWRKEPLDARWALERFPADIDVARDVLAQRANADPGT